MYKPSGREYQKFKKVFRTQAASFSPSLCMIPKNPVCFPDVLYTDLYYSERIFWDASTAFYTYRSSLFDPNLTGTGVQPKWYDTLKTVYNKYEVISMLGDYLITMNTGSTNPQQIVTLVLSPSNSNAAPTIFRESLDSEYSSVCHLTPAQPTARLTCFADVARITGFPAGDDNLIANADQNPAQMAYFNLGATETLIQTTNVVVTLRIKFKVRMFNQAEPVS